MYKALYLPVNPQPDKIQDGDIVVDARGGHFPYFEAHHHDYRNMVKVAKLTIVEFKFNQMHIIGMPSLKSLHWLKPGDEIPEYSVKGRDTFHGIPSPSGNPKEALVELRIECPRCGSLH